MLVKAPVEVVICIVLDLLFILLEDAFEPVFFVVRRHIKMALFHLYFFLVKLLWISVFTGFWKILHELAILA